MHRPRMLFQSTLRMAFYIGELGDGSLAPRLLLHKCSLNGSKRVNCGKSLPIVCDSLQRKHRQRIGNDAHRTRCAINMHATQCVVHIRNSVDITLYMASLNEETLLAYVVHQSTAVNYTILWFPWNQSSIIPVNCFEFSYLSFHCSRRSHRCTRHFLSHSAFLFALLLRGTTHINWMNRISIRHACLRIFAAIPMRMNQNCCVQNLSPRKCLINLYFMGCYVNQAIGDCGDKSMHSIP